MTESKATVVVGAQWGDEGKGKIVDVLSEKADVVVRYQGGANAGHTVVAGGLTFKLHLLPSGIVRGRRSLVGAGVVVDPRELAAEIRAVESAGIKITPAVLGIDPRAHLIFPWHNEQDSALESARGNAIGTTGRGIGPAYEDTAARTGGRFELLLDEQWLRQYVAEMHSFKDNQLKALRGRGLSASAQAVAAEYSSLASNLGKFACDVSSEVGGSLKAGKNVLFEGAQGTHLDNLFGTYPFVTSSRPIAGGACTGIGVGPASIGEVQGVVKAYTTRVGAGPFPTELHGAVADALVDKGREFGTTTGRKRRVGWFDAPLVRTSRDLNGLTGIHVTKLDVLGGLKELQVCTGYEAGGKPFDRVPALSKEFSEAKPVLEAVEGFDGLSEEEWRKVARDGRKSGFSALPAGARKYVERIGQLAGVPVLSVSVGPGREEIIFAALGK